MRFSLPRVALVALLAAALAAGAPAQPPSALDKLKADTAALAAERSGAESSSAERAKLTSDLKRLLERLDQAPPKAPMTQPQPPGTGTTKKDTGPGFTTVPVDRLRAAMNLVLADQTAAALDAFRQIDPQQLPPDDRLFVKFMTASCLRRLGRTAEALPLYREVSDSKEDAFYSSSAVSQLALLNNATELQAQLTKLRERPKTR